jgi:hypothetical protein
MTTQRHILPHATHRVYSKNGIYFRVSHACDDASSMVFLYDHVADEDMKLTQEEFKTQQWKERLKATFKTRCRRLDTFDPYQFSKKVVIHSMEPACTTHRMLHELSDDPGVEFPLAVADLERDVVEAGIETFREILKAADSDLLAQFNQLFPLR